MWWCKSTGSMGAGIDVDVGHGREEARTVSWSLLREAGR